MNLNQICNYEKKEKSNTRLNYIIETKIIIIPYKNELPTFDKKRKYFRKLFYNKVARRKTPTGLTRFNELRIPIIY